MTVGAFLRGRCVKKNRLAIYYSVQFVAVGAAPVAVDFPQRKRGLLVVVEEGRLPAGAVMAVATPGNTSGFRELRSVNVRVTVFTLLWRGMEINMSKLGLKVGGFVAVDTSDGTMCSGKREVRLGVIEARQLHPGFVGVASCAPHGLAVDQALHALTELPAVRIHVTNRAGHVLEVVRRGLLDFSGSLRLDLMTLLAGHGQMCSGQHEP